MAIPTAITDLSATIASNAPAGGDQAFPNIDDYLRAAYGFIRQGDTKAANIASAATVDLGAAVGRIVDVTGSTTVTSFGTTSAGIWRIVRFTGALTLTHNGTNLILPGAANITTAAGDCLVAVSLGSGNWVVTQYQKASGLSPVLEIPSQTGNSGKVLTTNGTAASWGDVIASGTWTPTVSSTTNVSSSTPRLCKYIRVGSIVHVSGSITFTPSSDGIGVVMELSLPVATTFSTGFEAQGTVTNYVNDTLYGSGVIQADTSGTLLVNLPSSGTGTQTLYFSGAYAIA